MRCDLLRSTPRCGGAIRCSDHARTLFVPGAAGADSDPPASVLPTSLRVVLHEEDLVSDSTSENVLGLGYPDDGADQQPAICWNAWLVFRAFSSLICRYTSSSAATTVSRSLVDVTM